MVTGRLREASPSVFLDDSVYQQYTGMLLIRFSGKIKIKYHFISNTGLRKKSVSTLKPGGPGGTGGIGVACVVLGWYFF